jgi:hypothetical protein
MTRRFERWTQNVEAIVIGLVLLVALIAYAISRL